jgi:chemotaxis methyl-accepting protein methylase
MVKFRHLNLADEFSLREPMDIIFCRNVLIYFSKETQNKVIYKLCQNLKPGGFLFLGHSEVIDCQYFPLISSAPAVYKKWQHNSYYKKWRYSLLQYIMENDSSINSAMVMHDRDFIKFRELIYDICGINLTVVKKTMLASRLRKRLRALGIESYEQYYDYVSSEKGLENECVYMLDAISTNKTDFFREPKHFDYLTNFALPSLINSGRWSPGMTINIWSAGCSSGEEPYYHCNDRC